MDNKGFEMMDALRSQLAQNMMEARAAKYMPLYLHVLTTSLILTALNDEMADSPAYSGRLKMTTKTQQEELIKKVNADISLMWGRRQSGGEVGDKALYQVIEEQERAINWLARMADLHSCVPVEDYVVTNTIMQLYADDPEWVKARLGINVVKDNGPAEAAAAE